MGIKPIRASATRIVIPVQNYTEAVDFYCKLLQIEGVSVSKGRTYFDLGGVILCIYHPESDGDGAVGPLTTPVYLTVRDVDRTYENAKQANANGLSMVERQPWGERSFYCSDTCGNRLCFVENESMFRGEFFVE